MRSRGVTSQCLARGLARAGAALAVGLFAVSCAAGAGRPVDATPAARRIVEVPEPPPAPQHGLPIPDLAVDWAPPRLVAGSVPDFAAALEGQAVVIRRGRDLASPAWGAKLERMVRAMTRDAPSVTLSPELGLGSVITRDPPTMLRRVESPTRGVAPRYATTDISTASLGLKDEASGGALVLLGDAALATDTWSALPAHTVGRCGPAFEALASGQEQSLAYLEGFLDYADEVLWLHFQSELEAVLPDLSAGVAAYASESAPAGASAAQTELHACGHADWLRVQAYRGCVGADMACAQSPRVFLIGGARIGSAEPDGFVGPSCAEKTGRDIPESLREVVRVAAHRSFEHLDPQWVALSDRLGAITEVHDALEDICTPRRRRFAPEDLERARTRLTAIGRALGDTQPVSENASWRLADSSFFVPGLGPVAEVARFDAGASSTAYTIRAESRGLRQFVLSRALCRSGYRPTPLFAAVVDRASGQASFASYFYEEELFCADLPPAGLEAPVDPEVAEDPGLAPPPSPSTGSAQR